MTKSDGNSIAAAINRLADAQFQHAKQLGKHNALVARQVAVSEEMLEIQKVNMRVSAHLEAELAARTAAERESKAN